MKCGITHSLYLRSHTLPESLHPTYTQRTQNNQASMHYSKSLICLLAMMLVLVVDVGTAECSSCIGKRESRTGGIDIEESGPVPGKRRVQLAN